MHVLAVLNRRGGALRDHDPDALARQLEDAFVAAGHSIDIRFAEGADLAAQMRRAAQDEAADVLLAGGGDGTVSLAAGLLAGTGRVLAVLPAGTMNLFARSLGIPLDLRAAVAALAGGHVRRVDIASANGTYFVHQLSIGLHPRLIELRQRMRFRSRLGKILASARAAVAAFIRPPALDLKLTMGGTELLVRTSSLGVANNLFGEGRHLPFAERPDGGELGIYITRARRRRDLVVHFLNMAVGRWRANEQVEIHRAGAVTITLHSARRRFTRAIDGELGELDARTVVRLHPGALSVLVPRGRA